MIDQAFGPEASISINIAAKQANDYKFMRAFADALAATGYAGRFMVELTEEAFLVKSQFQLRVLPMLREIGARVSIDDFGVGYSSLSALADITADEIKVDRSFITDIHKRPRNQSILSAIESLGQCARHGRHRRGRRDASRNSPTCRPRPASGCAQGYYFARPMFFDELAQGKLASYGVREVLSSRESPAGRNWPQRQSKQKGDRKDGAKGGTRI